MASLAHGVAYNNINPKSKSQYHRYCTFENNHSVMDDFHALWMWFTIHWDHSDSKYYSVLNDVYKPWKADCLN